MVKNPNQKPLGIPTPIGQKSFKTSLSLPAELATGLNRLAKKMGMSQSALVTALLWNVIPDMEELISRLPPPDDPDRAHRFRGESIDYVMQAVARALKEI